MSVPDKETVKENKELKVETNDKKVEKNSSLDSFRAFSWFGFGTGCNLGYENDRLLFGSTYIYGSYIRNPYYNRHKLLDFSEILYNSNGYYANVVDTIKNLPIINRYIVKGKKSDEKAKENYVRFLRSVNDKYLSRIVIQENLKSSGYYGWLSYDKKPGDKLSKYDTAQIFQFDPRYIRITGNNGSRFRIAINTQDYYNLYNSIEFFELPKEVREIINKEKMKTVAKMEQKQEVKDGKQTVDVKNWYLYEGGTNINLPLERTIAIPYNATQKDIWGQFGVLKGLTQILSDEKLQDRKFNAISNAGKTIVYEVFGLGSKGKGTTNITDSQQDAQHNGFKNALNSMDNTSIPLVSLAPDTKTDTLKITDDFIDLDSKDSLNRMGAYLGFSDALITGKDITDKIAQQLIAMLSNNAYVILDNFAKELNAVFDGMSSTSTQLHKVRVVYVHNEFNTIDNNAKRARETYLTGGSAEWYWANSGVDPEDMLDLLNEEVEKGYQLDLIKPRISPNNMSPEMLALVYGITLPSSTTETVEEETKPTTDQNEEEENIPNE